MRFTSPLSNIRRAIARHPAGVGLAVAAGGFLVLFLLPPGSEPRPGAPARTRGRRLVLIACDDAFRAFVDGEPAGESRAWTSPLPISIPDTDRVLVAVEATNFGGPGGLAGGLLGGPDAPRAVPASWVCHAASEQGWQLPEFDDGGWDPATIVARFGDGPWGLEPGAALIGTEWVWARVPAGENETIRCRWWISRPDKAAPPAGRRRDARGSAKPPAAVDTTTGGTLILAADDSAEVFVDGHRAGRSDTWASPLRLALPAGGGRVLVAVEARNGRGPGGLIAAWRSPTGALVPATWSCVETAGPGWNLPRDDHEWAPARTLSPYGEGPWGRPAGDDLEGAAWVWTRSPAGENETVHCRWWIPPPAGSKR